MVWLGACTYRPQVPAKDVEDLGELDALRELGPPPEDVHDDVGVDNVELVPGGGNQDEGVAHLVVRAVPVADLPRAEVVPREAVAAQDPGELLDLGEDLAVQQRPQRVGVVDGDDAEGQAGRARGLVVVEEARGAVQGPAGGQAEQDEALQHQRERHVDGVWPAPSKRDWIEGVRGWRRNFV